MRISILCPTLALLLMGACCRTAGAPKVAPEATVDAITAEREFDTGMTFAIQGDMAQALPHVRLASRGGLKPKERMAVDKVLARFDPPKVQAGPADLDSWTARVMGIYRAYWTRNLMGGVNRESSELALGESLSPLVGLQPEPGGALEWDALEPRLEAELGARGYHVLLGVTSPYREFLLWRTQEDKVYTVELPEGVEQVSVAMLDDFVSLGWVGYATGDIYHTGGWTTSERLYCLRGSYDLESESFRVSYLAHEGQHFADTKRFPALEQPELEYRAKLVEIAMADVTQADLLEDFSRNVSESRDQPHPFANRRVMSDLARALVPGGTVDLEWWTSCPPDAIRAAAALLLNQDTERLLSGGSGG